jgi:Domain of unknown function (DUF4386)
VISPMATARAVGVLFIVATATAIVGGTLLLPLSEPNYLEEAAANQGQIVTGALLEMVLVLSVIGIAVLLFPVLRRRNEGVALAYVGTRMLEAVLLLAAAVSALVVLGLSEDPGEAGVVAMGDLALATRDWTYLLGSMVMLGVSAVILYTLLYRAHLVPAWLSLWGLVGGVLILVRGVVEVYGVELDPLVQGLVAAPIGLNEMVLAVWLIVKGFNPAALADDAQAIPEGGSRFAPASLAPGGSR